MSLGPTMLKLGAALAANPFALMEASVRFSNRLAASTSGMLARALGAKPQPELQPEPKDRRVQDTPPGENPRCFGGRPAHPAGTQIVRGRDAPPRPQPPT